MLCGEGVLQPCDLQCTLTLYGIQRVHAHSGIVTGCLTLQGLTCEKKTESILVKEADLYSNEKMT